MVIRRKRNLVDAVLTDSTSAICVLDSERRIRFFSIGMHLQTGWNSEDVEGLICDPSLHPNAPHVELLTSALSPSIDVLNGQLLSVDAVLPRKNGTSIKVRLTYIPILDDAGSLSRIMLISSDSTPTHPAGIKSLPQELHAEITALRIEFRRRFSNQSFIGQCPQIRLALQQAELLKSATCGYSIVGPPGSGRRHLAKLIHVAGLHSESSAVGLPLADATANTQHSAFDSTLGCGPKTNITSNRRHSGSARRRPLSTRSAAMDSGTSNGRSPWYSPCHDEPAATASCQTGRLVKARISRPLSSNRSQVATVARTRT